MLPLQVAIALLAFAAAAMLSLRGTASIVAYHLVFAVGILPLILAAMTYFIPVLTRSGSPPRTIRALPLAALGGGLLAAGHFAFPLVLPVGHLAGAAITAVAVTALIYWALRRRRRAIGTPHPCLDWYLAAMACLLLALAAILAGQLFPGQRGALRLLHLHLNTLGFIGLTAFGTLQVLLPTCAQQPDPEAAPRLHRHLKWAAGGMLLIAGGAAWHPALAWLGAIALAVPLLASLQAWRHCYAMQIFASHGACPALFAAACGMTATLALGAVHATRIWPLDPVAMFIVAFLMPLVTGAASQLLPLWLRPGRQTDWHLNARQRLGYGSAARALVLLAGGSALAVGYRWGWLLALLAAMTFIGQAVSLAGDDRH